MVEVEGSSAIGNGGQAQFHSHLMLMKHIHTFESFSTSSFVCQVLAVHGNEALLL